MRLLLDIFLQTLRTLWAHKLRSFLTMFGIAWGVGSLLLLVGVGEGFRSGQRRQLNNIGENIMFIFSGQVPAVPGSQISARPYQLDYGDYLAIRDNAKAVRYISPVLSREDIRAVSEYTSTNGQVFGIVPEYNKIRTINMGPGRWINQEDETQHRRVAVIGSEMGRNLFPGRPAVGNSITLNDVRFEVIGVLVKIGKEGNSGTNLRFFIPVDTMRDLFRMKGDNKYDAISFLNYQPLTTEMHGLAKEQVHQIIGERHGFDWRDKDAFQEWDTIQNMQNVAQITLQNANLPAKK